MAGVVGSERGGVPQLLEQARPLTEAVPDGLVLTDVEGTILAVNGRLLSLTGHAEAQLLGAPIEVLVPSPLRSVHVRHRRRFWAAPTVRSMGGSLDITCRRTDGGEFPADIALSPLHLNGCDLVIAAVRDVSERKSMERARHEAERRFALLLDAVRGYAIFMLDSEGRVATWNSSAERLKGYRAEEILGRPISVFYPPEEIAAGRPSQLLEQARRTGRAEDVGWRVRRDGTRFQALVTITRLTDDFGSQHGFAKIVRDITDALQSREERQRLRLLEERERFGRDLHDGVIQSLFAVGMGLQLLHGLVKADHDVADRLQRSVEQLDDVIMNLREYIFGLRREPGAETMRRGIENLAQEFEQAAGLTIAVSLESGALTAFEDHATELLLLVQEALSNVARHSGARSCSVSLQANQGAFVLEVADDGHGFEVAAARAGLGLVNARARARSLGAAYEISSGPRGTIVRLSLPARSRGSA